MAAYHCPTCSQELKKGTYPGWVTWFVGPLFGQLFRQLICNQHGEIQIESLVPEERSRVQGRRALGMVGAVILSLAVLVLLFAERSR